MSKSIIESDTSTIEVIEADGGNIINCICRRLETTFWTKEIK